MSVKFIDNVLKILASEKKAVGAALNQVGIAAKKNTQKIIKDKDIYDTGKLHDTIDYEVIASKKSVIIGSPRKYAVFQELGTVKIRERPFLRPAIIDNISEYENIITQVLGKEMSASVGGLQSKTKYYQSDSRVENI